MISKQDKKAILNGALGITSNGLKCKIVERATSPNLFYKNLLILYTDDGYLKTTFIADDLGNADLDIVGLWQEKPEPFDLEKALAGEPVLLRDGSKAYIFHCINDEFAKKHNIGYQLLGVIVDSLEGKQLTRSWAKSGIFNEVNPYPDFDIIGMWREQSKPLLSDDGCQLPSPVNSISTSDKNLFAITVLSGGRYGIENVSINSSGVIGKLEAGRLYATREDVIKVIEAITGKQYEDR
ncbi:hypothetical protein [Actinobacillus pleuropneumoniae]|uniref:hypothetical protein n=1 Tax=Actinobacillus pleuropneumoniae TaxID=715 RepID=UPI003D048EB7